MTTTFARRERGRIRKTPTHKEEETFWRDYARLSREERIAFAIAVDHMVDDLKAVRGFRKGLRVKGVRGHRGIFEMTWADDGRATFSYGTPLHPGDAHIIWRRIGGHDIPQNP